MRRAVFAIAGLLAVGSFASVARGDQAVVSAAAPAGEVAAARAEIESTLAQMRLTSRHVRDQLRLTRKRGTARQVVCVDEALSRSDVAVRRARDAGDAALAAYSRGEPEDARALLRRVAEIRDAQRVAARDGAACTPGPVVAKNGTTVKVEVDPKIPRVQ
jgi:hypothetical protein